MQVRRSAIAVLVGTVITAAAAAGTNTVLAGYFSVDDEGSATPPSPMEEAARRAPAPVPPSLEPDLSKEELLEGILARNIFDHRSIGGDDDDDEASESDLDVRLIGTLVAAPAEFSSALIGRGPRHATVGSYGVGDRVLDAEIVEIRQRQITVRRGTGDIEMIDVREQEDKPGPRTARRGSVDDRIEKVGDDHYLVSRSLVDEYLTDPSKAGRLGLARPHRSDGEVDGYRLLRIRRNSPGYKLGIRNGDVVHAINGHSLTSVSEAMNAYQALGREGKFSIELTRRGKKKNLEYELR